MLAPLICRNKKDRRYQGSGTTVPTGHLRGPGQPVGFPQQTNAGSRNWFDRRACALQFSHQQQDEQDYDYESKPAAAIITGAVERAAADTAKAAE